MRELERALRPVKRRMRTQRTFIWALYGLFAGAVGVLLLRAASFVWAFPTVAIWGAVTLAALPAIFALVAWAVAHHLAGRGRGRRMRWG